MQVKIKLTTFLVFSLFSACAVAQPNASAASGTDVVEDATELPKVDLPNAELVARLPETVGSFEMQSAEAFAAAGDGVNVSYTNARKRRRANVFIYPVAEKNQSMRHRDLVMGSTQATMQAISQAVEQGIYQNLEVVDAATRPMGTRTIARVQATYLKKNLASYTLVYQTEHDGTMIKIRMTMPDNESNRESREWDSFADEMLKSVMTNLDLQNPREPVLNAAKPVDAAEPLNAANPIDAAKPLSHSSGSKRHPYDNLGPQSAP